MAQSGECFGGADGAGGLADPALEVDEGHRFRVRGHFIPSLNRSGHGPAASFFKGWRGFRPQE